VLYLSLHEIVGCSVEDEDEDEVEDEDEAAKGVMR
jgi:hypothetical protein